jgi:release factor glutamine methyltransferase
VTVLEIIQRSTEFLAKKGVESPRLQTELLLAHVLKLPRMRLYLDFERQLETAQVDRFRELIRRRGQREPLQYIVGSTSFCGAELAVSRQALIPRPETELLAEQGWTFLNQLPEPSALDFGTGTGCLIVALALKCPAARLAALDVSGEALKLARDNAAHHQVQDRIQWFQGPGFTALPPAFRCHLIISNPPYIPTAEIETLQPEVRDFEPRGALDGGADGLDFYRQLAAEAAGRLEPGGKIMLELGDGQAETVRGLFEQQNWVVESVVEDYTRRPRILIARI